MTAHQSSRAPLEAPLAPTPASHESPLTRHENFPIKVFPTPADLLLAEQLIAHIFTAQERNDGIIKVSNPGSPGVRRVIPLPPGVLSSDLYRGVTGESVEPQPPALAGANVTRHLFPHFAQAAGRAGLSFDDYARKIFENPEFSQRESEWLRLPLPTIYSVAGYEGAPLSGIEVDDVPLILQRDELVFNTLARPLQELLRTKMKQGDRSVLVADLGCGPHANETYAYAIFLRQVLQGLAREELQIPDAIRSEPSAVDAVERWCSGWSLRVVGYSIKTGHLESARSASSWEIPNAISERCASGKTWEWFQESTSRVTSSREGRGAYAISPALKAMVDFEWLNLRDEQQLERIGGNNDLIICKRVFYFYGFNPWYTDVSQQFLNAVSRALHSGGLFVTDSNVGGMSHAKRIVGAPGLYLQHPDLDEVPAERTNKTLLTSAEIANPALGWKYASSTTADLLAPFQAEIDRRGGFEPSGVYRRKARGG